jgi:hypothetical protein
MEVHCSQLARPMVCAGYLSFEGLERPPAGQAAEEGTAAAELLERLLLNQEIPDQARNGVYFDNDMHFWVKPIADQLREESGGEISCEQPIDWRTDSGVWIRGRYDAAFVREGRLYVDDLKYGWGIVEVRENWQLIGYAIGEVIRRNMVFEEIVLRIIQPRPHHEDGPIREWRLSYNELLEYRKKIEERFAAIVSGLSTLETGKHCKYCVAAGEACPAFNRLFYRALEVSTEFTQDKIDETELAHQLDQVNRAQEVLKIKLDSLNELATNRMKEGKIIPGYIKEERYSERKWKGGITPDVIETLTGKKVTETVMLSPAKVEKLGVHKDFVNKLVDRYFLGTRLVKKDHGGVADRIFGKGPPA